MQPQPAQQQAPQAGPQPGGVAQNGAPDYSLQWAEYYRSVGKIKEAEAIEAQIKMNKVPYYKHVSSVTTLDSLTCTVMLVAGTNQSCILLQAGQPGGAGQGGPPQQGPGGPAGGAPGGQVPGGQAYQAYGYAAAGYYGGQGQPPAQNQAYSYPGYGGYGGQPQGPDNQ
jgi:far upstream element-binding protein